jgi:hypothetical protein
MKSKKDKLESELLNLRNLVAIILADIDIFLLQNKSQTKDLDRIYDKNDIRKQLHKSGSKIVNVLSESGYDIDKPLKRNSFLNQ